MTDSGNGNSSMSNQEPSGAANGAAPKRDTTSLVKATLARRYAAEKRFKFYGIFAIAAVIALAISWIKHKHVSGQLLFVTGVSVVTAGLAIAFDNKAIFFIKPTIINSLFGVAVIGGIFIKKNVIKMMMGSAFELPDAKWNVLAIRWGLFFFAMAILNEIIWRNNTETFWISFKTFGFMPLTLLFTLTQIPFLTKHGTMRE